MLAGALQRWRTIRPSYRGGVGDREMTMLITEPNVAKEFLAGG